MAVNKTVNILKPYELKTSLAIFWSQKHASTASFRPSISAAKVLFTAGLIILDFQAIADSLAPSASLRKIIKPLCDPPFSN